MRFRTVITGASSGLGRDFARKCALEGHDLVLTARRQDRLESLAAELKARHGTDCLVIPLDLSRPGAAESLYAQVTEAKLSISFLINNAGFGVAGALQKNTTSDLQSMLQLNVIALAELTRLFLPGMRERRFGRILQVASTAAFLPGPYFAGYYASKAFVLSFSSALIEECRGTGVQVTTLCPGWTATEFQARAGLNKGLKGGILRRWLSPSSAKVVSIAYRALWEGQPLVIPGWGNRVLIAATRLLPQSVLMKAVGRFNRGR
jgi:short-subunit dehydrogenase